MTPFSPELMQTLEDLIPTIYVCVVMAIVVYITFLNNALINARQTCKDQGNMLAEYVHLQADDLIKVQNAHKNEDTIRRKCIELETENARLSEANKSLLSSKNNADTEIKALKDKISRKNEPRDAKGHFIKTVPDKKNPNIGKYRCDDLVSHFEMGHYYERYQSKEIPDKYLVLIGDDRQRHQVMHTDFTLITE